MEYLTKQQRKELRYKKMMDSMIKRYGSVEAYREHMKSIGTKGGKLTTNRPFKNKELASKAAYKSAEVRRSNSRNK